MKVPTKEQIMADARENWQTAYKDAKYQVELSHKNAKGFITQAYEDAKEQTIQEKDNLGDQLIETYTEAANRIDQINMSIQVPPLKNMTQSSINSIYNFYGKLCAVKCLPAMAIKCSNTLNRVRNDRRAVEEAVLPLPCNFCWFPTPDPLLPPNSDISKAISGSDFSVS